MALTNGTRLGPYEILALIGAGGMGEVYKATDTRLDRAVAVKVLPAHLAANPEFKQRLEREARAVAALNHPHICALHDIGNQDGIDFLVFEFLEGETVAARLEKGPLPPDQVLRSAVQVADALDKAHRKGFTHRDLKPGNIMLTKAGAKLLDFGLAKLTMPGPAPAASLTSMPTQGPAPLTVGGTILGTFQYMAPEQLEGKDADARSDIFAFGAVVYEMATGRKAFPGKTHTSIVAAILSAEPPPISTLQPLSPAALDRLVSICLAKDPEDRWQTTHDLVLQLQAIGETAPTPARVEHAVPASPARRPLGWMAASALLALATVALAAVYILRPAPDIRQLKLTVLPPEKASFNSIAISPDGRRLAFAATDANGKTQLWVRPLDSMSAQPLAGTEEAAFPFWSPDNRFVGFFAQSKLKKIEVAGGPPQTLCDAPGFPRGGAWSRQGVIIFSSTNNSPLSQVPVAGGQAKPLTSFDQARQETSHRWPYFLPDGRHFLYLARAAPRENRAIYAASLDSKDRKLVIAADSSVAYSPPRNDGPSHLLFMRERTLMAQPFDARKLQTTGDPFPVAEQVGLDTGSARGHFSLSENGVLVHDPSGSSGNAQLTWFDRAGKTLATVGPPGSYVSPALSPDEKRVVVDRLDPQLGNFDLWMFELTRGVSTRFTFDPRSDLSPAWSPDGSRVVFASVREGFYNLYQKVSSGAGQDELLLKTGENKFPTDWSLDGRFIAYSQDDPKTKRDLWVLPLEGERKPIPFLRTEFSEERAAFSPDGRWIAYASDESTLQQVYVQPVPPSGAKWQISTNGGTRPRWRRDGKELFYLAADRKMMAVEVKGGASFEAGIPKELFQARVVPVSRYAVTGDGRRFLLVSPTEEVTAAPTTVVVNWDKEN